MDDLMQEDILEEVVQCAKDYAQGHGLCMRLKGQCTSDLVEHSPFTLFPTRVEKRLFEQAYEIQKDMNLLYHRVAFDYDFLNECLKSVVQRDPFTRRLLSLYKEIKNVKLMSQIVALTIQRSDYMFHCGNNNKSPELKQVEVNTIAASFAGLSNRVSDLHRYLLKRFSRQDSIEVDQVPNNNALNTVARGLVSAWQYFNKHIAQNDNTCILFVVEEVNRNVLDQRAIEDAVLALTDFKARIVRFTFKNCNELLHYDPATLRLCLAKDPNVEVSIVYYRVGYVPQHYPTEMEWGVRRMLELSRAIKSPWIGAHLAGTKKVQQVLASPGIVEKFLPEPFKAARVTQTFVGLYSLDRSKPQETARILEKVCQTPEEFVLKPQLEGGGNNFYGEKVKRKLLEITPEEREAYILMDRLHPAISDSVILRPQSQLSPSRTNVVSEMGTFGYLLCCGPTVIDNHNDGHLLRTKSVDVDEGGVMAGASALDSPSLFEPASAEPVLISPKL